MVRNTMIKYKRALQEIALWYECYTSYLHPIWGPHSRLLLFLTTRWTVLNKNRQCSMTCGLSTCHGIPILPILLYLGFSKGGTSMTIFVSDIKLFDNWPLLDLSVAQVKKKSKQRTHDEILPHAVYFRQGSSPILYLRYIHCQSGGAIRKGAWKTEREASGPHQVWKLFSSPFLNEGRKKTLAVWIPRFICCAVLGTTVDCTVVSYA